MAVLWEASPTPMNPGHQHRIGIKAASTDQIKCWNPGNPVFDSRDALNSLRHIGLLPR
jgi:hypothetical protein